MYRRDLSEDQELRILQAARAILAAAYDPMTMQANWPDADQLGPMALDRLMRITRAAVGAAPGGTDEQAALREIAVASTSFRTISDCLGNKRVRMPFSVAVEIGSELRYAAKACDDIAKFVALSNKAFEALEGLVANWPTTDIATKYEPDVHRSVMMKDKAIDEAIAALKEYREVDGAFTW